MILCQQPHKSFFFFFETVLADKKWHFINYNLHQKVREIKLEVAKEDKKNKKVLQYFWFSVCVFNQHDSSVFFQYRGVKVEAW